MGVASEDARPAEVVGHPEGVRPARELLELPEVVAVEGVRAPDGERDAVEHDGVALGDLVEDESGRPPVSR